MILFWLMVISLVLGGAAGSLWFWEAPAANGLKWHGSGAGADPVGNVIGVISGPRTGGDRVLARGAGPLIRDRHLAPLFFDRAASGLGIDSRPRVFDSQFETIPVPGSSGEWPCKAPRKDAGLELSD